MPARSEAQRRYLNAKFGHDWVKKHDFDNKGKLPKRSKRGKRRDERKQSDREKLMEAFRRKGKRRSRG